MMFRLVLLAVLLLLVSNVEAKRPGGGKPPPTQTIASITTPPPGSSCSFTSGTTNDPVCTLAVTMSPASPSFSGTLALCTGTNAPVTGCSGANTGGFHLAGSVIEQSTGGSGTAAGVYSDVTAYAAQGSLTTIFQPLTLTGTAPGSQTIASIVLDNTATTTGLSSGTLVGTLSVALSAPTPTFDYTGTNLHLSTSGADSGGVCNGTNGAANGSFQITSAGILETNGSPTAGTKLICVAGAATGVTASGQAFTITVGHLLDAAASVGIGGCTGSGTSGSPWNYLCIQNAMNAAVDGDTVFLRGGNWALSTADPVAVVTATAINLVGAGSGNTFDAWGHISNVNGVDQCPTGGSSITCVYGIGTSYGVPPHDAGFIQFFGCNTGANVAHIFFDGSHTTDGGDSKALLSYQYCAGPNLLDDIRVLAFNNNSISQETQIWFNSTNNTTVRNSTFADPTASGGGSQYSGGQTFQYNGSAGHVTLTNNAFFQGGFNPIYVSFLTFTGNQQYDYNDGTADTAILPAFGPAASQLGGQASSFCSQTGTTGICDGDVNIHIANNLFYSGAHPFGLGAGVNDPTGSGGMNDIHMTGNWIVSNTSEIDACEWYPYGNCTGNGTTGTLGMSMNMAVDASCNVSANGVNTWDVLNNSLMGVSRAALDERGNVTTPMNCKVGNPWGGTFTTIPIKIYNFNGQHNYLSSASNQYVTNANTVSPVQQNNYCAGSGGVGTVTGCATSGFTTPPTCSFTSGPLTNDPVRGALVPLTTVGFTAQYGAVQWLASTTSTPPLSSDSRWSSNNSFWSSHPAAAVPAAANSYIQPTELEGVSHGQTIYLWVMDSANNISSACSALIP